MNSECIPSVICSKIRKFYNALSNKSLPADSVIQLEWTNLILPSISESSNRRVLVERSCKLIRTSFVGSKMLKEKSRNRTFGCRVASRRADHAIPKASVERFIRTVHILF